MDSDLINRVRNTFENEEEHKEVLDFMLSSPLGNWIKFQTQENINELAILLKQYSVKKLNKV